MKKIFIQTFCIIFLPTTYANTTKSQALATLESENLCAADNARLELEQMSAESELLEALKNVKNKKLRDGILYSLGTLNSQKAYPEIIKIAFAEKDACPAAIFAVAKFNSKQADADLEKLLKDGSIYAKTALFMRAKPEDAFFCADTAKKFSTADENLRVKILKNLPADNKSKKFLMSINPDTERTISAHAFALAKIGGRDCASRIFEDAKKYPNCNLENALAECCQSEEVIIKGIQMIHR